MTLKASDNAIFSQESAAGAWLSALLEYLTTCRFGQALAHVSHLASPQKLEKVKRITATFYQNSPPSLASKNLQALLESRLETLSNGDGWTKQLKGWKQVTTPSHRPYFLLLPLARVTRERESTGWLTPMARDEKDINNRSFVHPAWLKRHSPSMAILLLMRGVPWTVISGIYCLAMGFPLSWNE